MRRRTAFLTPLLLVLLLALAAPGAAVTDGERDTADEHPYVVAAQFYVDDEEGGRTPVHLCSGTLLDDDLVLTAAHCTTGMDGAEVWPARRPPTSGRRGGQKRPLNRPVHKVTIGLAGSAARCCREPGHRWADPRNRVGGAGVGPR